MQKFFAGIVCLMVLHVSAQSGAVLNNTALQKLSPIGQIFLEQENAQGLFFPDADGRVPALVQVSNPNLPLKSTAIKESQFGNIFSIRCNRSEMISLMLDANVSYIEISSRLNRPHLLNDTAMKLSKVDLVQDGVNNGLPVNYRGNGVVVGIVDIGFQPDNPTFFTQNGAGYKVKRWWLQGSNAGNKPTGFSYGTEATVAANILLSRNDDGTHGTHVGGIAAGSGYTTPNFKYRGMAPEADLAFVTIKYGNDTLGGSAKGDYLVANPSILDGFKYVFDYAQSVGKPAVINLSWGMHTGPHDGNSLFDKAVELLTGPGKILVGACGNDAGNKMHVQAALNGDTAYTFALDRSRKDYVHENIYCDFWGDSAKQFGINFTVFDTSGIEKITTPFYYSNSNSSTRYVHVNGADTLWLTIATNKKFVNNAKPEILIMAETNNAVNQNIRIGITGNGRVDGWNSGQTYRWTAGSFTNKVKGMDKDGLYLDGLSAGSMVENGGTSKASITVGAYIARNSWRDTGNVYRAQNWLTIGEAAGFSSRGPTVDGRIKPDISAPGQHIVSAVNYRTFAPWMIEQTPLVTKFYGNPQYWTLLSGTSMAAPHVAGIVALMLQVNPDLTPVQVRMILSRTAYHDVFTGNDSNNTYGFGKADAMEAIKMLVNLNINDPGKKGLRCLAFPNPANNEVLFSSGVFAGREVELTITDITGKLVYSAPVMFDATGLARLATLDFANGIYSWRINGNLNSASGRIMIRH